MEPDRPDDPRIQPEEAEAPAEGVDISDVEISQVTERDAVLAAVMREQSQKAEQEEVSRKAFVRRQGYGIRHVALVLATAISVWIWIWPPSALRLRTPGPPPTEQEEATLRLVMYFQAQKIERYRLDTGRVPLELDDAGPVFRGMEYIRLTDRDYRILGRTSRVILSYSSVEPIDAFVGDGANILELGALD